MMDRRTFMQSLMAAAGAAALTYHLPKARSEEIATEPIVWGGKPRILSMPGQWMLSSITFGAWNLSPMSPMRETVIYDVRRSTGMVMLRLAGGPNGGWWAGPDSLIFVPNGQHLIIEANKRDHRLEFAATAMRGQQRWACNSDMTWTPSDPEWTL